MKPLIACLLLMLLPVATRGQGTLVYDQESSSDEVSTFGSVPIQAYGTVGQSFTPSLSTVGFVRLRVFDLDPRNGSGATLTVNLRATAINGPLVGTALSVVLGNGYVGATNFIFADAIPVVPSTAYYFEAVVQSGDNWGIVALGDDYPNGSFYSGGTGTPFPGNDLWFREGIVVPEPSSVSWLFLGGGIAAWVGRRKARS